MLPSFCPKIFHNKSFLGCEASRGVLSDVTLPWTIYLFGIEAGVGRGADQLFVPAIIPLTKIFPLR